MRSDRLQSVTAARRGFTMALGAGAHVAGVYYGPNVDTTFSGGMNWWGAVIGNDITISGGPGINIDEGLFSPAGGDGTVVTAWTETAPERI